jgi:Ca2+:H+ antiporter
MGAPILAAGVMAMITAAPGGIIAEGIVYLFAALALFWNVLAVLHNSEVLAARAGEPLGTLVLTLAVTAVEVSVIYSVMLSGEDNPTLAREAVFSTVMIVATGVVGICLLRASLHSHEAEHNNRATSAYLAVLITLSGLTLILPNYTTTTVAGTFSHMQLGFAGLVTLLLYGSFLYMQTVVHRGDFTGEPSVPSPHIMREPPTRRQAAISAAFLLLSLAAVVVLAEAIADPLDAILATSGLPDPEAVVGMLVAATVLLPEAINAIKASNSRSSQQALNISLGSALATIGLTIPAVIAGSFVTGEELVLGLQGAEQTLLVLALAVSIVSFGTGSTNVLTGMVHLVLFGAFILTRFLP